MLWTKRQIAQLKRRAAEAERRIREVFESGGTVVNGVHLWGQFLDGTNTDRQYGIYGTSAAVQVLAEAAQSPNHDFVAGASRFLETEYGSPDSGFQKKGDLHDLFKLSYLAEAIRPGAAEIGGENTLMSEFMIHVLPEGGWGRHWIPEGREPSAHLLSTAVALLALKRYREFRNSRECERALQWLCKRIIGDGGYPPFELAMATLALVDYTPEVRLAMGSEYTEAMEACRRSLLAWAAKRSKGLFPTLEAYYYSADHTRYLFFLPDCLVALAFLRLDCPERARQYVLNVTQFYVTEVLKSKTGFSSATIRRASSVDHLWLFRLLRAFRNKSIGTLLPRHSPWIQRGLWVLGIVVFTRGAFMLENYRWGPWSLGTLLVTIVASVIANLITALFPVGGTTHDTR